MGAAEDVIGIAVVINSISNAHKAYFMRRSGILIGDGQLPNAGY